MNARVTVEGVPNEPVSFVQFQTIIGPILASLGDLDAKDVVGLHITPKEIRAKVIVRDKRGRRVNGAWAHLVRHVDITDHEAGS